MLTTCSLNSQVTSNNHVEVDPPITPRLFAPIDEAIAALAAAFSAVTFKTRE